MSKSSDVLREGEVGLGRRDESSSDQTGHRTKGFYTHKLCYPSERHDDVLPLVLGLDWQQAHRDFQHPLQQQLQFGSVSCQQGFFPFKLLPFRNAHKASCQSLTPQSVHSFTCRLTPSFAITLSPVVASRSLSPNRSQNDSPFPMD